MKSYKIKHCVFKKTELPNIYFDLSRKWEQEKQI